MRTQHTSISRLVRRYAKEHDRSLAYLARKVSMGERSFYSKISGYRNWSLDDVSTLVKAGILDPSTFEAILLDEGVTE